MSLSKYKFLLLGTISFYGFGFAFNAIIGIVYLEEKFRFLSLRLLFRSISFLFCVKQEPRTETDQEKVSEFKMKRNETHFT